MYPIISYTSNPVKRRGTTSYPTVCSIFDKGYRYGFNGKERDNEINVNGGDYDFEARIYDGRLGRWLSLDPLMPKYPGVSPYNYAVCNPIYYVDLDGKEYGVYIDHASKTIIIKATYHAVKGDDAMSAKVGVNKWNEENGKWQYVIGEGDNAVVYDIKFELTVKEHEDATARDIAFDADVSGEGNKFQTYPRGMGDWGITVGENGGNNNSVKVENSAIARKRNTPGHEIGHSLSLGHWIKGLLLGGDKRGMSREDSKITLGNVSKILNNAGVGVLVETDKDKQVEPPADGTTAKSTVSPTGTAPADFPKGKVEAKPL